MIFRLERCGMKFGHIGDLHIGKRVHDFSMLEDQRYILDQMMKIFEEQLSLIHISEPTRRS